jgi:hypothetical protein
MLSLHVYKLLKVPFTDVVLYGIGFIFKGEDSRVRLSNFIRAGNSARKPEVSSSSQLSTVPIPTEPTDQSRFMTRKLVTDALRPSIPESVDPPSSSGSKAISTAPRASSSAQRGSIISADQKRAIPASRNPPNPTTKNYDTVVRGMESISFDKEPRQ